MMKLLKFVLLLIVFCAVVLLVGGLFISSKVTVSRSLQVAAKPPRRVRFDLFFPDFGTTSQGELRFDPNGTGTTVTWTMNGDMGGNPLHHGFALFDYKMVGLDFAAGAGEPEGSRRKT